MRRAIEIAIEDFEEFESSFPKEVKDIIGIIGAEATAKLINAYGGTSFPVSKNKSFEGKIRYELLATEIGHEAANMMVFHYGGDKLYIPHCKEVIQHKRDKQIKHDFDAISMDHTASETVFILSAKYGLSDRWVWNILKT